MRHAIAFLIFVMAAIATAVSTTAGQYRIDVVTDPATIPVGRANLVITVKDAGGQPVSGAEVRAIARMPGMNMGEREQPGRPGDRPGEYVAPAIFSMAGLYEATITVNGQSGTVQLRTGQNTAGPGESPLPRLLGVAAGVALLVFILFRVRKTNQRVDWHALLSVKVGGALLVLGGALAIAVWAVNNLRRPGAMTPIESQAMEMNTPAPEGTQTVNLAKAEVRAFEATLAYTGQAVGFTEQDVVARVTGAVLSMPVYVGDKVIKGQVLARLDTTQIDPEIAMRSAAVGRAQEGVGVAALEHRETLDEVSQARAEVTMAQGELAEVRAMLEAAEQGRGAAESELRAAQAEVAAMEAEVSAVEADRDYMRAEYERAIQLFDKGAVSRDELQKAKADAARADAMVRQAEENVRKARAMVSTARSMQRRVNAEILAASRKVEQATAGVRAKEAMVRKAQSGAQAAEARIGQERAMVREANAGLRSATTQRQYAQLQAETDGVVTQRLIGPGQVVVAGQSILKIAQVAPIRLQANVPESDLAKVRVGSEVKVSIRGSQGPPIATRVSSVAPALELGSRTGTIEALYPNLAGDIRPGQFVTMEITVGAQADAVVIPMAAVVRESVTDSGILATGERAYVWVAEPIMNGEFELRRQEVRLGMRAKADVAVLEGLSGGEQVVVSPSPDLKEGRRVVPPAAVQAATEHTVTVTERGYEPASLVIPANKPATITFIRKADPSCGDTLEFPELGIKKNLPLNEPVQVEIPAHPPGEIKFACGMDMYRGKVVVR